MEDTESTPNQQPDPTESGTDSAKATTATDGPGNSQPGRKTTKTPGKPSKKPKDSKPTSMLVPEPPEKGPGSGIDRERYEKVALDFCEGMTVFEVRRKHGLGMAPAMAIRKHLGELVPNSDTFAAQGFEAVRDLSLKLIYEKLINGEGKMGELSVVAGVSADKLDIIRGRSTPTQVHQHIHISHTSVQDLMKNLPVTDVQSTVHGPKSPVNVDKEEPGSHLSATEAPVLPTDDQKEPLDPAKA